MICHRAKVRDLKIYMTDFPDFQTIVNFRSLFEAMPEPCAVLAPDGVVVATNRAFLRITNTELSQWIDGNFFELATPGAKGSGPNPRVPYLSPPAPEKGDVANKVEASGKREQSAESPLRAAFEVAVQQRSPQSITLSSHPFAHLIAPLEQQQEWTIEFLPIGAAESPSTPVLLRLHPQPASMLPQPQPISKQLSTETTALPSPTQFDRPQSEPLHPPHPTATNLSEQLPATPHLTPQPAATILTMLFKQAPLGIGIWNEQLQFVRLNEALADLYDLPNTLRVGKTIEELLPKSGSETGSEISQILQQVLATKQVIVRPFSRPTSFAQQQRYWQVYYYPIEFSPQTTWICAISQEITEQQIAHYQRKQTEAELRAEEARFQLLAENSTDIISRQSIDGIFLYLSPACQAVLGYQPDELIGRSMRELIHLEDFQQIVHNYPLSQDLPAIYTVTHRTRHKQGHYLWLETTVRAIRDPDTNRIQEIQASSREITERKRVEEKQQFLMQASSILSASLDYETTLVNLSQLMVPTVADWCVVDVITLPLDYPQTVQRLAVAHADPAKQDLVEQLRQYPLNLQQVGGVADSFRTGRPMLISQVSDDHLQAAASNPEHLKLLQALAPKSGMCVPLVARGQVLGAISLAISTSDRRYNISDRLLVEELAHRAAIAVDNARLYQEARQLQQIAERAAIRTSLLQSLTAALSESVTLTQVAEVIGQKSLSSLNATAAFVALLTPNGTELEIVHAIGEKLEMVLAQCHPVNVMVGQRLALDAPLLLTEAVRANQLRGGTSLVIQGAANPAEPLAAGGAGQAMDRVLHDCVWLAIPLTVEARAVGGIGLAFAAPRTVSEEDQSFAHALALQGAQAIERARLYEAEQRAREAAETVNRLKDEFLAVLSHELRSPLNPILGWVKLLQTRPFKASTTQYALETIERNAKLQAQLVEDLLDVSRILRGKLTLTFRPLNLNATILAALETVRSAAAEKSIHLHSQLDPSLPSILGDANRLQQVVVNLLSNAVKFTPAEGRVEIRLQRVPASAKQEHLTLDHENRPFNQVSGYPSSPLPASDYAQITVHDTGQGITAEFLPHVFDSFRQADGTTTRKFGGLGLGLAIVRQIVARHGGTVVADSAGAGQGATFTVWLPLPPDAPEPNDASVVGDRPAALTPPAPPRSC
jgi:PAS domain S-box-containing protein